MTLVLTQEQQFWLKIRSCTQDVDEETLSFLTKVEQEFGQPDCWVATVGVPATSLFTTIFTLPEDGRGLLDEWQAAFARVSKDIPIPTSLLKDYLVGRGFFPTEEELGRLLPPELRKGLLMPNASEEPAK
jgi:hypothetical protein